MRPAAKEEHLEQHRKVLEKQMQAVKRQRAALLLQRRERELRDAAARSLEADRVADGEAAERDVAALRLELERREADCEARRAALKREMDRLCRDYEDAASAALELRAEFEAGEEEIRAAARAKADARAKRSDAAIRAQLEKEALALGFRMSPRGGDGGG